MNVVRNLGTSPDYDVAGALNGVNDSKGTKGCDTC